MSEIFDELPELLIEAVEPDRYVGDDIVKYIVPDDFLVVVNRQSKPTDSPVAGTPTLETLKRNMNRKKEADNQ